MQKRNSIYYMKQCRKTLLEITKLGPADGVVFLRLKKRAARYLEKAKEAEAREKGTS